MACAVLCTYPKWQLCQAEPKLNARRVCTLPLQRRHDRRPHLPPPPPPPSSLCSLSHDCWLRCRSPCFPCCCAPDATAGFDDRLVTFRSDASRRNLAAFGKALFQARLSPCNLSLPHTDTHRLIQHASVAAHLTTYQTRSWRPLWLRGGTVDFREDWSGRF